MRILASHHIEQPLALRRSGGRIGVALWRAARAVLRRIRGALDRILDELATRVVLLFERLRSSPEVILWVVMGVILLLYVLVLAVEPNAGR